MTTCILSLVTECVTVFSCSSCLRSEKKYAKVLKYSLIMLLHIGKLKCAVCIVFHGLKVNDVFTPRTRFCSVIQYCAKEMQTKFALCSREFTSKNQQTFKRDFVGFFLKN